MCASTASKRSSSKASRKNAVAQVAPQVAAPATSRKSTLGGRPPVSPTWSATTRTRSTLREPGDPARDEAEHGVAGVEHLRQEQELHAGTLRRLA